MESMLLIRGLHDDTPQAIKAAIEKNNPEIKVLKIAIFDEGGGIGKRSAVAIIECQAKPASLQRGIDPSLAVPFWDSTLESHLPNPCDSHIFAEFTVV